MTVLSLDEHICISREDLGGETKDQSHSNITAAIKLRLWQVSQRILFDPRIMRRLKPMQYSDDRALEEDTSSHVMLDQEDLTPCSATLSAEVEDYLLLEDGPSTTPFLSIEDDMQDEHDLLDDLHIDDFDYDDDDLLDTDECGDGSLDSLFFDLKGYDDFMDLEAMKHWKCIDGSCILEEGITENMAVEENNSMLEDCS